MTLHFIFAEIFLMLFSNVFLSSFYPPNAPLWDTQKSNSSSIPSPSTITPFRVQAQPLTYVSTERSRQDLDRESRGHA